jgi:ParB-like chromosome segregation protein Spo0J
MSLEVRTLPVRDLTPAPYNPRRPLRPTDPAYKKLRAGLEQFGLVEPLVWNEPTGHVVGGHARLRILCDLGVEEVPVSVVRLSDAGEKALNVLLNNQEAQGRYDPAKLADLLDELRDLQALDQTGFDDSTLANLRYEPAEDAGEESAAGRVEVTLTTDADTFARLEPRLDELVRAFDLESHVRRG